jgi:DNA-binding NarL/FixJ family response regulator
MQLPSVVVFQSDPGLAQSLSASLARQFPSVHLAHSLGELRDAIPHYRADVAILDVEASNFSDVEHLHHEFPGVAIVCTHRVADEEMWAAALNAGASDMCPACDTKSILSSAVRSVARGDAAA